MTSSGDHLSQEAGLFQFSTDDIRPQDRIAVLRDILCRVYLRADFISLSDVAPRFSTRQFSCGSVRLTFVESDAFGLARGPEYLSDGDQDFRFVLPEDVPFEFESASGIERMSPGDAMVVFNGEAGTERYLGPCRGYAIRIGHQFLLDAVPRLKLQPSWRIAAGSPTVRLLSSYLRCLHEELPSNDRFLEACVERHLIQLVALALKPNSETQLAGSRAVRMARLATIRADLLANLSQARLSAKSVARRHGVTDRYVHRLFEETGETFGAFVERERTKRAFALLTNPTNAGMRIIDIALVVGYTEHSTFNRAFRRWFGDTPSAIRRNHRRQRET